MGFDVLAFPLVRVVSWPDHQIQKGGVLFLCRCLAVARLFAASGVVFPMAQAWAQEATPEALAAELGQRPGSTVVQATTMGETTSCSSTAAAPSVRTVWPSTRTRPGKRAE